MSPPPLTVLTAVTGEWEAPLVAGLERSASGVRVVRRCVDLGELLSVSAAGLARAVLLSADLQRLDREAVAAMLGAGGAVGGPVPPAGVRTRVRGVAARPLRELPGPSVPPPGGPGGRVVAVWGPTGAPGR